MISPSTARALEAALSNYYRPAIKVLRDLAAIEQSANGFETPEVRAIISAANMVDNAASTLADIVHGGGAP